MSAVTTEYPSVADYVEALQHPRSCFRDADLKASSAEPNSRGDPWGRTGANGAVFKLTREGRAVAVKVFFYSNDERAQRYQLLSDFLGSARSRHLVGFRYFK